MARALDPEIAAGIRAAMAATAKGPAPVDLAGIRAALDAAMESYPVPDAPGVTREDLQLTDELAARLYRPQHEAPGALVVFLHGGGRIAGSLATHDRICAGLAADGAVLVLAVDYRLAPEHPSPAAEDDAWTALVWADAHRAELGAVDLPLVVAGDSAGGGLAALTALRARDAQGPALALQLLLYPMLDDRTKATDRRLVPLMTWTPAVNALAWGAALGAAAGTDAAPAGAVPARAEDLAGLPATYLEVGDCDLFLGEVLGYATRLAAASVPLELHVHPGMPHAGEAMAPEAALSATVRAARAAALRALTAR